jgi:hypothetical protein
MGDRPGLRQQEQQRQRVVASFPSRVWPPTVKWSPPHTCERFFWERVGFRRFFGDGSRQHAEKSPSLRPKARPAPALVDCDEPSASSFQKTAAVQVDPTSVCLPGRPVQQELVYEDQLQGLQ